MEVILNLLDLTQSEREAFQAAAPESEHLFRSVNTDTTGDAQAVSDGELARATIILGNPHRAELKKCSNLAWLQTQSAGVNLYLAPGVLPSDCILTSAVGCYGPAVSEHMFASALALMKHLPTCRDHQNAHLWSHVGIAKSFHGATVLLLGTGDIGSHFAQLAKALDAHTIGLNRHPETPVVGIDELHPLAQLDQWLPQADVVAMSLPETPETIHLMDARRLGLMKSDAILVNAGRGSGVDCLALATALRDGTLWGAALDVTEPEPLPADHPLWDCPNLLLTPHSAGGKLEDTTRRIAALALENLKHFLAGEPLRNRMK